MVNAENAIRWFQQYVDEFVELTTTDEYNHRMLEAVLELLKSQHAEIERLKEKTGVKSLVCKDCGYNESCEITHLDDNPVCENFTLMN